jgi:hypothetical protein
MMMLALVAIAFSTFVIAALCLGDPKRRRSARVGGEGHQKTLRRLLAAAACAPALFFIFQGDSAAFLLWFGGCAAAGWFVTLSFARSRQG